MIGHNGGNQSRLNISFNFPDHVPANHLLRGINQFFDLVRSARLSRPVLQSHWPPLDRSGADDPDVDHRLLFWDLL